MRKYASPEEEWRAFLMGTHPHLQHNSALRFIPSSPRCRFCKAPFRAPGGVVFRRLGFAPWPKNPKICSRCFDGLATHARMCPSTEGEEVRGAEVELSMLFADVRGSSKIARQMPAREFTVLMNRFYRLSTETLLEHDAILEKFVGDEVVGLFVPCMTGPDHAARAVEAAQGLLRLTGHGSADGPWIPIGVGVHTGSAFVGIVGSGRGSDFTALGDPVNIAAHLASEAGAGEILVTEAAASQAGLQPSELEQRHVLLKGHPVDAVVLPAIVPPAVTA